LLVETGSVPKAIEFIPYATAEGPCAGSQFVKVFDIGEALRGRQVQYEFYRLVIHAD